MKALMVAFTFTLPYHVMRAATAAGYEVHVLGGHGSRGLRLSRACARFRPFAFDHRSDIYAPALTAIADACAHAGADLVLPSDDVSTRMLIALRDRLPARTSALSSLRAFDMLNDKWTFNRIAVANGACVPQTWLYRGRAEVREALRNGVLKPPLTFKPRNLSGTAGVRHLREGDDAAVLDMLDYQPIVVQRFIDGTEVGVNVLCRDGEVVASAIQHRTPASFRLTENAGLLADVSRVMRAMRYHGPANLDVILAADSGLGHILECNPRFWYTVFMSRMLGLNFVDLSIRLDREPALAAAAPDATGMRLNRALFTSVLHPASITSGDWRLLRYHFADPLAMACDRLDVFRGIPIGVPDRATDWREPDFPAGAAAAD